MFRRKVLSLRALESTAISLLHALEAQGFSDIQPLVGGSTASVFRAITLIHDNPTSVIIKGALKSNTQSNGYPHIAGEFSHLRSISDKLTGCMANVYSDTLQTLRLSGQEFGYFMMEDCGDSLSTLMKDRRLDPGTFSTAIRKFMQTFIQDGLLSGDAPVLLSPEEQYERWSSYYMSRLYERLDAINDVHPELTDLFDAPQIVVRDHDNAPRIIPNLLCLIRKHTNTFRELFQPHALFTATHRELNTGNIALNAAGDTFKAFDPHSGSELQETYDFGKLLFGFSFCDVVSKNRHATLLSDGSFRLAYRERPISDPEIKATYSELLRTAPELEPLRELEPNFLDRMHFIESFQHLCDMGYRIGDTEALLTRFVEASVLFFKSPSGAKVLPLMLIN